AGEPGELRSRPAVETTLEVLAERGAEVAVSDDFSRFVAAPGAVYQGGEFEVNGDWPGAAALLCAAAVVPGSRVEISGLRQDAQGERRVLDALRDAGCRVEWRPNVCGGGAGDRVVRLESPERLRAFRFDADLATDAAPALTAAAACAEGT